MASLGETVASLTRRATAAARAHLPALPALATQLQEVPQFGSNPGALRLLRYRPDGLARGSALVVVLHGCGQTAAGYDHGAGWSTLAARFGFALLLPEQIRANNAGTCFNWFNPADVTRGQGEAASVAAMIAHELRSGGLDPRRVFVTGLSAGGAFANALLATYPDVFAAGAIVAGLPYGAATNVQEAFEAMSRGRTRDAAAWGNAVRAAAPGRTRFPRIAIWHGMSDMTVIPANATDLADQWRNVHGLRGAPETTRAGRLRRQSWHAADGAAAVELCLVDGLAHGVPISAADADPARRCGAVAPFCIESGVSSSYLIARSWGLTG